MKLKFFPCKYNEFSEANKNMTPEIKIKYINEDSIRIDGVLYEFNSEDIEYPHQIHTITNGVITEAHRDGGILHLTIVRHYLDDYTSWFTGEYIDFVEGGINDN